MMMSAQNARVALVTGASSGIGEATVERLLAQGFIVYAGARRVDRMTGIEQRGAHTLSLDVTDDQSMTDAVGQILQERNRIDVLVNNAGYGSYGSVEEVEIAAVATAHAEQPCFGFTVRATPRRAAPVHTGGGMHDLPRSVEQMTELVGRVSMKALVRETTDLIEKLCIEAALAYTSDNRASAAEMLGLSRQSLYVKLRRYGMQGNASDPE